MKFKKLIAASAAAAMMATNQSVLTTISYAAETAAESHTVYGEVNGDGKVSISDAVAILQYIANKDKFPLSAQALINADCVDHGDGVTAIDAIAIQLIDLHLIDQKDLPITSAKLYACLGIETEKDEEPTAAELSDAIYAFGVYNKDTNAVDIEWLINDDVNTVQILESDDDKTYTSAAVIENAEKYSYDIDGTIDTKYFKVAYTDNEGKKNESFPFFITVKDDTYVVDSCDSDKDGISDMFESAYGCKIDSADTDKDGLSDYEEVNITKTDPAIFDSHKKGVSDADADCDEDGIGNKSEIKYGTDPLKKDTDLDGLTDFDELIDLKTDPLHEDTDKDGLTDYAEHRIGTDPLNPKSLGHLDGEVFISQAVRVDAPVLQEINTEENPYKLAVDMNVVGFAEEKLSVSKSRYTDYIDEEAIVGDIIDVTVAENTELDSMKLRFNIKEDSQKNKLGTYPGLEGIKRFTVFQYNEDVHMLIPMETYYSESENSAIAYIDGTGTYCIMDTEIWFDSLGITPEGKESPASDTLQMSQKADAVIGADAPQLRNEPFEIVFAIQTSGYDGEENFKSQKKLIQDMGEYLFKNYDDVVIHIIPYNIQTSLEKLKDNSTTNDFSNLQSLEAALDKLEYHEMWGPANRSLAYRQVYNELLGTYRFVDKRFVIHLMNAGTQLMDMQYSDAGDGDFIMSFFWNNNVNYSEVYYKNQPDSRINSYLTDHPGVAINFDANTNYDELLAYIIKNVTKYKTYEIATINGNIKVVLKGELGPNSDIDSDGDGVVDWNELDNVYMVVYPDGKYEFPTYTDVFKKANVSTGKNSKVPYGPEPWSDRTNGPKQWKDTSYGPQLFDYYENTKVAVWKSDPSKKDTDNDGILDIIDNAPFDAIDDHFTVVDDYSKVTYRQLLSNGYEKVMHDSDTSYLTKVMTPKMFADYAKLKAMAYGGLTELSSLLNGSGYIDDFSSFVDVTGQTPNASIALFNFLDGKGRDLNFGDFSYAIALTTVGRYRYYDNMNSFFDMVEKNTMIGHQYDFSTVKDIEKPRDVKGELQLPSSWKCNYHDVVNAYDYNASIDWWLAVGGGQNALASTVTCYRNDAGETMYKAKIKYYLLDFYDWSSDGEQAASNLHASGLAKAFLSYGCYETELEWKKGARFPGDAWGNSKLCAETKVDGITDSNLEANWIAANVFYNVITK